MMRSCLLSMTVLIGFSLALASAQTSSPMPDKKTDAKSKDGDTDKKPKPAEQPKPKSTEKADEVAKPKITLDKLKTPNNAVIVLVDEFLKATELVPYRVLLTPEEYQKLRERLELLERQLKPEKKLASICKLYGKQEGDFLTLRAVFSFSTQQPKTAIFLGLLGAHLTDAKLDQQAPFLESTKDGFLVHVEKEGDHQLTLHLRARIDVKKATGGATEYGLQIGLPGTAVTTLQLELPNSLEEIRCNGMAERTKTPGRWLLPLDRSDTLVLAWKQPIPMTGDVALPKVEEQIKIAIDTTHVNVKTDFFLEDPRARTTEWQLLLPPNAVIEEVNLPAGLTIKKLPPDGSKAYHTLVLSRGTSDVLKVSASLRLPRPDPGPGRLPIGPFIVLGAYSQKGTISVSMPADVSLGQRLIYHPLGKTYPLKNGDTEAIFEYGSASLEKNLKTGSFLPPLDLEWRNEKNQLETRVEHLVKLKTLKQGWEIEATTLIKVKAIFSVINTVDLRLPLPRSRGNFLIGTATPAIGYPATLPWPGLWNPISVPFGDVAPEEFSVTDAHDNHLKLVSQDSFGRVRVILDRGPTKEITLKLKKTYQLPATTRRIRLELPRPANTQDGGAKVLLQSDERVELLYGPSGSEAPVPEKHHFEWTIQPPSPSALEFAWHPFQRETVAHSLADVTLHEHTAQVKQTLSFVPDYASSTGFDPKQPRVVLGLPRGLERVTLVSGGEVTNQSKEMLWIKPNALGTEEVKLVFEYDLAVPVKNPGDSAGEVLHVPFVWPTAVSRKEVKVRVWSANGGTAVRLTDEVLRRGVWKERSIEAVKDKDSFPVLVVHGSGARLDLALRIEASSAASLAAFLADRGLIQILMHDDGSQQCRARFWVRKINTHYLDIELPLALSRFRDPPTFMLGKHQLHDWKAVDAGEKTIRLKLNPGLASLPTLLEISYTIPPENVELGNSFWRTTLNVPQLPSSAIIGQLRWQLSLPTPMIATALSRQVRPDYQWSVQGWLLTPEPSVSSTDLESWLTGEKASAAFGTVSFAFSGGRLQPQVIYHWPRQWWLLSCSGLLLIVALAAYFSPVPRVVFWLVLLAVAVGLLVLGVVWPATLPPLLFGSQPGLVLLVTFIGLHWYWQERYRRQLIFLPAFSRTKSSSSMTRSNSAKRPREASTVDAPTAPEGSASAPAAPAGS